VLIRKRVFQCSVLLSTVFAASGAAAQAPEPDLDEIVSQIKVLPRYNQWQLIEPALRSGLEAAARMPREQRERLVRAGNAGRRGIGIFVAGRQGDVAALLSYANLLDDREATLPFALPTAGVDQYAQRDQTVGDYLSATYLEWFGVDVDGSPARFKRLFGGLGDPNHLVYPWIVRLRRAASDTTKTAQLKQQIGVLPEQVRWAVLTLGYQNSVYTLEEARGLLAKLSPTLREALDDGDTLLPEEPLFRMNDGAMRRAVRDQFQRLVSTSQP
jgi:hypothetical protein